MQRIDELTEPPVVGRRYLVPCVEVVSMSEKRASSTLTGWLPVTGPRHEDAQHIDFPFMHWHYDFRFLSARDLDDLGMYPHSHVIITNLQRSAVSDTPILKVRTCKREALSYPHEVAERAWLKGLREAYADKRVTCGKCPHRGLPLSSLPREPGTQIVTCPGHGLRWDLGTGQLVHRAPEPRP